MNKGFGFTPHARGSTTPAEKEKEELLVYPACAGIDPWRTSSLAYAGGLPRMRGDRPLLKSWQDRLIEFTPHARGSTLKR